MNIQTTEEMQNSYWEELLPMALECGMTPTQFWEEEPRLVNSYIRKHQLELNEFNYKSWLLNVYTYKAVSVAIGQSFADKKESSKIQYFEKPIEEFYTYKNNDTQETKQKTVESTHRQRVNYWSKFAKKGGK